MSNPATLCPSEFVGFSHQLAEAAGSAIRPHFRNLPGVETKADASPVTVADRAAEQALRQLIEAEYPAHGIFGEEFGTVRGDADYVWILDPIDGTKSFVAGLPIWGTLIALTWKGHAILGVIDQPILRERWVGCAGQPTRMNGNKVLANATRTLPDAVLFTTSTEMFTADDRPRFQALSDKARIRRHAGDCYAFGLLASGFADLVVESEVKPYDFAALVPVVQGAGGAIGDWAGQPLAMNRNSRVLAAANPALLRDAAAILSA